MYFFHRIEHRSNQESESQTKEKSFVFPISLADPQIENPIGMTLSTSQKVLLILSSSFSSKDDYMHTITALDIMSQPPLKIASINLEFEPGSKHNRMLGLPLKFKKMPRNDQFFVLFDNRFMGLVSFNEGDGYFYSPIFKDLLSIEDSGLMQEKDLSRYQT